MRSQFLSNKQRRLSSAATSCLLALSLSPSLSLLCPHAMFLALCLASFLSVSLAHLILALIAAPDRVTEKDNFVEDTSREGSWICY